MQTLGFLYVYLHLYVIKFLLHFYLKDHSISSPIQAKELWKVLLIMKNLNGSSPNVVVWDNRFPEELPSLWCKPKPYSQQLEYSTEEKEASGGTGRRQQWGTQWKSMSQQRRKCSLTFARWIVVRRMSWRTDASASPKGSSLFVKSITFFATFLLVLSIKKTFCHGNPAENIQSFLERRKQRRHKTGSTTQSAALLAPPKVHRTVGSP